MSEKMLPPEALSYGDLLTEIERLQKKCDYKDEVIEQRNAECSRQFKEIERLQRGFDACVVDNEQYEQANNALNAEIERLQVFEQALDQCIDERHKAYLEIERLQKRNALLEDVAIAAEWFSVHTPSTHIPGLIQRTRYKEMTDALDKLWEVKNQ